MRGAYGAAAGDVTVHCNNSRSGNILAGCRASCRRPIVWHNRALHSHSLIHIRGKQMITTCPGKAPYRVSYWSTCLIITDPLIYFS